MQKLCGGRLEELVGAVARNFAIRKNYQTARELCDKFSSKEYEEVVRSYVKSLKKEFINMEIGDFVLSLIKNKGTIKEECEYFELLERGLKSKKISLAQISLGQSKNGSKKITLADVWPSHENIFAKERIV